MGAPFNWIIHRSLASSLPGVKDRPVDRGQDAPGAAAQHGVMQAPLQIVMQNVPRSEALEARIRDFFARLEQFHPRITSCRVAVDEIDRHRQQGRQFRVKVEVRAPGREPVASTLNHHEDVYVALHDAFDAVRRQLEDAAREVRVDIKSREV
jgi:ribosomal subunit interface protein